jgi:hypothetical protein
LKSGPFFEERKDLLSRTDVNSILEDCKDIFSKKDIIARDMVKVIFKAEDLGQ